MKSTKKKQNESDDQECSNELSQFIGRKYKHTHINKRE